MTAPRKQTPKKKRPRFFAGRFRLLLRATGLHFAKERCLTVAVSDGLGAHAHVAEQSHIEIGYRHGVNTIILRNRLRVDGYEVQKDEVNDALQSIRLVRAHARDWNIDPNKIGIMGFSAGGELSAPAAVLFDEFDKKNSASGDPLAGITSRPDFVCLVYPGGTPFSRNRTPPPIPHNVPPSFVVTAGSGDQGHAVSSMAYFSAMLDMGVPNIELHVYGNGRHAGGLSDRNGIPFGTWQDRYIDWIRDLGFLQKPGIETKAARDIATFLAQPPRPAGGPTRNQ